jgi:hypothetical protein
LAIYVVTLRETYAAQECINRFSFVSTVEPSGITGSLAILQLLGATGIVAGAFPDDTLLKVIQDIQHAEVQFNEIEARNLYDVSDFYTLPFVGDVHGGTASGNGMSPVLAYGFRSNRVRTDIRRGTKRLVGVNDNFVGAGGVLQAGAFTPMQNIADALTAVLNPDNTDSKGTYTPSVLHYHMYTSPPARKAYRPFDTEGAQLANVAIGVTWDWIDTVRSQVSRQYGHGS